MRPWILVLFFAVTGCGRGSVPVITSSSSKGPELIPEELYLQSVAQASEIEFPVTSETPAELRLGSVVLGLALELRGEVAGLNSQGTSQIELFFEEDR